MKRIVTAIVTAAVLSCAVTTQAAEQNRYTIKGDLSSVYVSGDMVVWTPRPRPEGKEAAGAAGASMAMSSPAASGDAVLGEDEMLVARAPLKDGKFVLEGSVDKPQMVYFYVLNSVSTDGKRYAPTKGQGFILEPGQLTMTMESSSSFVIRGGKTNDAVYNSWKLSDAYRVAKQKYDQALGSPEGSSEAEKRAHMELIIRTQGELLKVEENGYKQTGTTHPDPQVRMLALQANWLGGRWQLDALHELDRLVPGNPWVQAQIVRWKSIMEQLARQEAIGAIGSDIKDFTATGLDGTPVALKDVRARSKYVLVEFWASWCGPCRAEIPHMKKAYERYRREGFEILSFTIDDDRKAWAKASDEEKLPWLNTGMGSQSEPKKLYEVNGVPANYLVDSASGKVIARNLRGYKLDDKLKELLD